MTNDESGSSSRGVSGLVHRFLESFFAFLTTKLELVSVELEEEKRKLIELLCLAAAVIIFAALALTILAFLVAALFWEGQWMAALLTVCGLYALIALGLFLRLRRRVKLSSKVFEATLEELKKDGEWMQRHL